ncbi:MAG TPA: hypothetical protein PKY82_11185 [Pyrinomonadaceae bacterium]|nr:hypothetical protein [Pyrinomonadaceae bacterium]
MKVFRFFFLGAFISFFLGCSIQFNQTNSNVNGTKTENVNVPNSSPGVNKSENTKVEEKKNENVDNSDCQSLKKKDLALDKKQTFAIDFKPFEKSCFATFYNPEFSNPNLDSQFFIFKDGKEVFTLPQPFGGSGGCWTDAVAFEDVNNDQLTDIIIVGKCGAKMGDYNENMVYLNTGKDFVTNANSNAEMMDFSKVSQIKDFVQKNPKLFTK